MSIQLTDNHQYNMKKLKNVKKCADGGILSSVLDYAPGILTQGIGAIAGGSQAASQREAGVQTASNILGGAASGAQLGNAVGGPLGAGIGAVIGAIPGIIGKKGKVTPNGFYEDPSVTYSTGLFRSNKGIRRKYNEAKQRVAGNRIALSQGQDLESQFDYDDNVMSFASGGYSSNLAYVDDGELIQTPDGEISKVPENGKPTDSNLVNLPEGSRILSDKIKVPGTKKTFAQMGEEMMTKRKSKGKDKFAENANKLNEMNNSVIHNQLFEMQESLKQKNTSKRKIKGIQAFKDGGTKKYDYDRSFNDYGNLYSDEYMNVVNSLKEGEARSMKLADLINSGKYGSIGGNNFSIDEIKRLATDRKKGPVHNIINEAISWWNDPNAITSTKSITPKYPNKLKTTNAEIVGKPDTSRISVYPSTLSGYKNIKDKKPKTNWGDVISTGLSGVASLAPVVSNLFTSDPETVNTNYNPYANTIARTMRNRRFDITPAIEDLNRSRAISNYNAGLINPNTGANLAYRLQNAIGTNRAIAGLRTQESAANNQYSAEYASTLDNLGQQFVNALNLSTDLNAQNRAAARNVRRTGLSQLSQYMQNRELMRNQRTRDDAMLTLYRPFLEAGFTTNDLSKAYNAYVKGGNRYGR